MISKIKISFILMLFAGLSAVAQEHYDFEQDGIYYKFVNGEDGDNVMVTSKYEYSEIGHTGQFTTEQVSYKGVLAVPNEVRHNDKVYTVSEIDRFAFCNCTGLTWLTLPESIKEIHMKAISNCGNIRLELPNSIQGLGEYAFQNTIVDNTQVLELPDIYTFSYHAMSGASYKKVVVGGNVWDVKSQAFAECDVETIEFTSNDRQQQRDERLHFFIKGLAGFKGNEIRFPNRVFNVSYDNISDCPNLERVFFAPVIKLGHSQDRYCYYVETGRESGIWGDGPFECGSSHIISRCPNLKEVICFSTTPIGFYNYGYIDKESYRLDYITVTDKEDCVLKVPAGSEELYRADPVWGHFKTIEGFEPGEYTGIYEPMIAGTDADDIAPVYYNLQGMRIDNPVKGNLYIRKQANKTTKVYVK